MKRLLVLRPEPGNGATAARARELGLEPVQCPLFALEAVAWDAPDWRGFDYALFTSANALRHGGEQLAKLTQLEALAVGAATADAARDAGFQVARTGEQGVDSLLAALPERTRLLHLAGADHRPASSRHPVDTVIVYRSVAIDDPVIPSGKLVAMVHSPRAGARLADLQPDPAQIAIAAISAAAAAACGGGWATVAIADQPSDGALLALAARLCQD